MVFLDLSMFFSYLCLKFSKLIIQHLKVLISRYIPTFSYFNNLFYTQFLKLILLQHEDVEANPEHGISKSKKSPCCHWTINIIIWEKSLILRHKIPFLVMTSSTHYH